MGTVYFRRSGVLALFKLYSDYFCAACAHIHTHRHRHRHTDTHTHRHTHTHTHIHIERFGANDVYRLQFRIDTCNVNTFKYINM